MPFDDSNREPQLFADTVRQKLQRMESTLSQTSKREPVVTEVEYDKPDIADHEQAARRGVAQQVRLPTDEVRLTSLYILLAGSRDHH